jgi:hypothetical protein
LETNLTRLPQLEQLINEQKIPQLILPRLGTAEKNVIDQKQWTFDHAGSKDNKEFSALPKQRVVNYLRSLTTNLDELGILTANPSKPTVLNLRNQRHNGDLYPTGKTALWA